MAYDHGTVAAPAQCSGTELQTFLLEYQHKDIKTSVNDSQKASRFSKKKIYHVPITDLIIALNCYLNCTVEQHMLSSTAIHGRATQP